jgi:uncharacterized protein YuzE
MTPRRTRFYLRLSDHDVAETLELSRSTYLDVDADGAPVGFEILHADPELLGGVSSPPEGTLLRDVLRRDTA